MFWHKEKQMEFWFSEFHTPDVKHSIRVNKQLYSKQSDYQRIDIFETPEFGRVLTLDGNVMLTERDEFIYDEMIVHVPMAVHKEAKDILVIGAGDGGVVRELTRYDRVERIDLVEMDPQVVEACRAYLPGNACRMDDRRVHIYFENALKYIRRCEEEYDLIIVDSSDPFGPSEGLFTREFYGSCFNALKEDGIMVNQQGSPFYTEDASAMQRSHKRIASTFPVSRVYQAHIPTFAAGYWLFGFASKKYHPIDDLDADAWKALNLRTRYYTTRLHVGAFYLPAFLEEMLREVDETFIGCDSSYRATDIVLYGAPFDSTTSYRPGARFGPSAIRHESFGLETYSPYQNADLTDFDIFDSGDLELCFGSSEAALADIEARAAEILHDGKLPLLLGGEHLVTLGAVRAVAEKHPGLHIIHFDAHADLRDDYLGAKLSHACVLRRCHEIVGDGRIHQFCIRSGERAEFEFAAQHTEMHKFDFTGLAELTEQLCATKEPVYLTIDLDCLDPSCFPGTGTPEAGGVSFLQLLDAIRTVSKANIVGADLNELAPMLDISGVSTATACKVLRELLIALDKGWPGFQV